MFEKKYDYVASLWRRVNRRGGDIGGGKEDGEEDQTVRPSEIYNCVFVFLKQRHLASVYQFFPAQLDSYDTKYESYSLE